MPEQIPRQSAKRTEDRYVVVPSPHLFGKLTIALRLDLTGDRRKVPPGRPSAMQSGRMMAAPQQMTREKCGLFAALRETSSCRAIAYNGFAGDSRF
ncbi:MAG: hypothetical protein V3T83_05550 [Acidobacteriota bacterium]